MASSAPDPVGTWAVLVCPSCQARSRVRAEAAHRKALCPRCKTVIPPKAAAAAAAEVPPDATYGVIAAGPPPAPAPALPRRHEVEAEPDYPQDEEPPPVPRFPLWRGVYGFPWHPGTLRAWFLFGFGLSLVALMGAAVRYVILLYAHGSEGAQGLWFRVLILYVKGLVLFLFWTGAYAAEYFFETVQDTAAGIDRVKWPGGGVKEKVFSFLYLFWLFVYTAIPLGILVTPLRFVLGVQVFFWSLIPSFLFVFPLALLSSLANDSGMIVWNGNVFASLVRKPLTWLQFFAVTPLLLALCLLLGALTIWGQLFFLVPLTGYAWAACLLIYGRLLGRVAWVISGAAEQAEAAVRRAKRAKRRAER
jgi:hypothetical protein